MQKEITMQLPDDVTVSVTLSPTDILSGKYIEKKEMLEI